MTSTVSHCGGADLAVEPQVGTVADRPRGDKPCDECTNTEGKDLLQGRTVLVTGVLRPTSLATAVAVQAQQQGARVILSSPPRALRLTTLAAREGGVVDAPVVPLDVTDPHALTTLADTLHAVEVNHLDGIVHAIAQADGHLLGNQLSPPEGEDAIVDWQMKLERAVSVSVSSLAAVMGACAPVLTSGSSVVALTFESERVVPGYGWMGPLKAALEASVRGLAVEYGGRGVRVNAVSAGPVRTPAGCAIPGFDDLAAHWERRAPLGWDSRGADVVGRTVIALLSSWLPATTGQVIRADGGVCLV